MSHGCAKKPKPPSKKRHKRKVLENTDLARMPGLDWNAVYDCCQALSLFSYRQLIEIEIPESGVNAQTAKELSALVGQLHQDILLLVIGPKLTKAQENAA